MRTLFNSFGLSIFSGRVYAMQALGDSSGEISYVDGKIAQKMFDEGTHKNIESDSYNGSYVAVIRYKDEEVVVPVWNIKVHKA